MSKEINRFFLIVILPNVIYVIISVILLTYMLLGLFTIFTILMMVFMMIGYFISMRKRERKDYNRFITSEEIK